jgi:predicted GNAT family N-acyltransferase
MTATIVKFIQIDSPEYQQALELRYQLFYQMHHLPFEVVFTSQETAAFHVIAVDARTSQVIAYGQLAQNTPTEWQICQMVVEHSWQGRGLGSQIMAALLQKAELLKAKVMILEARVTKVEFYQKLGFIATSTEFPSLKTGVPHIRMQKCLTHR